MKMYLKTKKEKIIAISIGVIIVFLAIGIGNSVWKSNRVMPYENKTEAKAIEVLDESLKKDGNGYANISITFENVMNIKSIECVSFNIYFYDENNKCIQSDSIGSYDTVKAGAEQTITKRVKMDDKYKTWNVELDWLR